MPDAKSAVAVESIERLTAAFRHLAPIMATGTPSWVQQLRKTAMGHFREHGFPTMKDEEWRFTHLGPLLALPLQPVYGSTEDWASRDLYPFALDELEAHQLVFLNGAIAPNLSRMPGRGNGVDLSSLAEAMLAWPHEIEKHLGSYLRSDLHAFAALNMAFFRDGAFLQIRRREHLLQPIHLIYAADSEVAGASICVRNLILAGAKSKAVVIEHYVSRGATSALTLPVTEILLEPGAEVEHIKIDHQSPASFHVSMIHAHQLDHSRFVSHSIATGSRLSRTEVTSVLDGSGSDCLFNGLYLGKGAQLIDHHTRVDHAKAHCTSHEFYHGVLNDRSHGVFNGKIYVHRDAQKTDAKQTNRNLLLSDDAVIDTKPQLEIYADDVKCTHGATVGALDDDALFYLRSRGIGLEDARRMLIRGFAGEIIDRISVPAVRDRLEELVTEYLAESNAEPAVESALAHV
jgi:Fe-S cluster assembly protein SufD